MERLRISKLALSGILVHLWEAPLCAGANDQRPNIILLMADDLGFGDVGFNGNTLVLTPNLDRMASQGIRFTRFYSVGPVCSPTRAWVQTVNALLAFEMPDGRPVDGVSLLSLLKGQAWEHEPKEAKDFSMRDTTTVMVNTFSILAIIFSICFLLLMLFAKEVDNEARSIVLEADYEEGTHTTDTSPEHPHEHLSGNDDLDVAARVNTAVPERLDDSQALEAVPAVNLAANETLPPRKNEEPSLDSEHRVDVPAGERLPQQPDQLRAIDAKRQVDVRLEATLGSPSESVAEPVGDRLSSPLSIVNASNNVSERSAVNSGGQSVSASPGIQLRNERAPISPDSQAAVKGQVFRTPETNDTGSFVTEQEARVALQGVGYDPISEMVWIAAINDPYLPPNSRQNLIEDLNEDGFPDFRNITFDDLPLIINRMAMLEDLFFEAMDDANAEAFLEAHKDLNNMYDRLTTQ